jgi:hypothetical protein
VKRDKMEQDAEAKAVGVQNELAHNEQTHEQNMEHQAQEAALKQATQPAPGNEGG